MPLGIRQCRSFSSTSTTMSWRHETTQSLNLLLMRALFRTTKTSRAIRSFFVIQFLSNQPTALRWYNIIQKLCCIYKLSIYLCKQVEYAFFKSSSRIRPEARSRQTRVTNVCSHQLTNFETSVWEGPGIVQVGIRRHMPILGSFGHDMPLPSPFWEQWCLLVTTIYNLVSRGHCSWITTA